MQAVDRGSQEERVKGYPRPLVAGTTQPTRSSASTYTFEIGLKHFFQFLSIGIGEGFSKHRCWRVFSITSPPSCSSLQKSPLEV